MTVSRPTTAAIPLAEIQAGFANHVLTGGVPDTLADDGRQAERFSVYRNNTFASIRAVLADAYPTVCAIVGDALFSGLSAALVRHAPARGQHLLDYGADLPDLIERSEPLAGWPWLGDVARVDWARNAAYAAGDAPALDPSSLQGLDPEQLLAMRLDLHPSAVLLTAPWPVHAIWMNPEIARAPYPASPGAGQGLQPRPEHVLVARPQAFVETVQLEPAEYRFLSCLAEGQALGEAAAAAAADPAFDLMSAFARHLGSGLFAAPAAPAGRSGNP